MIEINFNIDPVVPPLEAFKMLGRATGRIAEGLRRTAILMAKQDLRRAEWVRDGRKRHRAVKRARDTMRRMRKLEMQRRGWK